MIEIRAEETEKVRCYAVGMDSVFRPLFELSGLIHTLGMEICGSMILHKTEETARFGIGTGKADEISHEAEVCEADCIVFDFEISPTRQRNWETLTGIPVFDRNEVILRIFASRAQTKEAVLQVELARLSYSLPRLAHSYGDMARQRGGSYGAKGSGETQLELDRRSITERIGRIKEELKLVVRQRETRRKRREKIPLVSCALVGYTNAGKSSLLNALTGADVFVEDKLFATLDPTTRRLLIPGSGGILFTDTVGFISNLPHTLIDAFKSTLEEACRADLLLIVLDVSDPAAEQQYETVESVLREIGAAEKPRLLVLNKTDKIGGDAVPFFDSYGKLKSRFPDSIDISAKTHTGFDVLKEAVLMQVFGAPRTLVIPLEKQELLQQIRQTGVLESSEWLDDGIHVRCRWRGTV